MSRPTRFAVLGLLLAGCGLLPTGPPPPAPSVEAATAHLERNIAAGIARDWRLLCSLASGTCERELEGAQDRAPDQAPQIVLAEAHEPIREGDGWSSGGVLFVLCGVDGLGDPYESEVLVFDDGRRLLAAAAVYWTGTRVSFAPAGEPGMVGEPPAGNAGCA